MGLKQDPRNADQVYGRVRSMDPDNRSYPARLRARLAAACAAGRARLRSQGGSVLIEVMVGAVVLSVAAVGLLNGLDGAQGTGAQNKARSVAAVLAEQDQERLRAMPAKTLPGYTETRPVTVRGVVYTVTSTGTWATDTGGPVSCSNSTKTASNIRIVSAVSSNATKGIVDEASLVTPPPGTFATGEGRAVVKLLDRNAAPISGALVNLTGTASFSGTTNSLGCVVFPFVPEGNYTASVSRLGLVDWQGNSPATKATSVTADTSTLTTFEMDNSADIRANFDTVVNGTTVTANVRSQWLTVLNSKLTVGTKTFQASPVGSPNTLVTASPLFPFLDGYGVYAGNCTTNNPALAPTGSPGALQVFTTAPGQIVTTPRVRMPAVNVRVVTSSSTTAPGPAGLNGATIKIKSADAPTCGTVFPNQTSAAVTYGATTYQGALQFPGLPYGRYKICAQRTTGTPAVTTHGSADVQPFNNSTTANTDETVVNTNPVGNNVTFNGATSIRIWIKAALTGPCP